MYTSTGMNFALLVIIVGSKTKSENTALYMQNLDHCGMYVLMVKTVDDNGVESMYGSAYMAALAAAVQQLGAP